MIRLVVSAVWLASVLCLEGPLPAGRLAVPEFEIDLDLDPEDRFKHVYPHFAFALRDFVNFLHAKNPVLASLAKKVSDRRGKEPDEMQREMAAWAKLVRVSEEEIHFVNMLYEFNTLMVPITNLTGHIHFLETADDSDLLGSRALGMGHSEHESFPLRFGCTGIIATDDNDGTVYHARNLDFSFAKYLQRLTYTGIFKKNGTEIFRAQTIAAYSSILTGMRKGSNGFTVEVNTRFNGHLGWNKRMFKNLFRTKSGGNKADLSGWTKRKILENSDNYEDAVASFSSTPYVAPEYNIVAGVKKGVILARDPDGLAFQLPLDKTDKKYIIMTNFDYPWHDIKENFDPSVVKGRYRRKAAEKMLDQADVLSPELLFSVLNEDRVMAKDTIFQVIMNVELGLWNASLPACKSCGRNASVSRADLLDQVHMQFQHVV